MERLAKQGLFSWLWEIIEPRFRITTLIIICFVSIFFIILSNTINYDGKNVYLSAASNFSTIFLTAFIAGVILKILAVEGFFLDAVVRAAYGKEGLNRLSDDEKHNLWRDLTIMVYAPFIRLNSNPPPPEDLAKLAGRLSDVIRSNFNLTRNFYHRNWRRRFEITWQEGNKGKVLVVNDDFRTNVIPFRFSEVVNWETQRIAEAHLEVGDYIETERDITINGVRPGEKDCITVTDGRIIKKTYRLSGYKEYETHMDRDIGWQFDHDPTYSMAAIALVDGGSVEVANRAEGLQIVINEVGGSDLFKSSDSTIVGFERRYFGEIKSVLLPGQGIQLIFVRERLRAVPGS
jgi:hypothetical protein